MGFFSSLLPIAGGLLGNTLLPGAGGAIGSALGGALAGGSSGGSQPSGSTTTTTQQQIDPRLQALLYGDGSTGSSGLLQQIAAQAQTPQASGYQTFGSGINQYLGGYGVDNFLRSQQAAQRLQGAQFEAPLASNVPGVNVAAIGPSTSNAAQVNAPAQNNIDLTGSYNRFINGDAGANPYLTQGLKAAEDATTAGFNSRNNAITQNLQRNILPGLKSNAILSGGFGGSRQGIAEGNALSDYTRQLTDANSSLSAQNNANAINAQAGAFNAGQDRALAATQGLGAQQYGVASQNAALQQQTNLANQQAQQQAVLANQGTALSQGTTNANLQQGVNLANLQSHLNTIAQNDQRNATGIGLSSGLLGQAAQYGQTAANADWQKLLQGSGALGQYGGLGGSQTQSSPYYTNPTANALSGATGALSLYNMLNGNNSSGSTTGSLSDLFGSKGRLSFWN